MPYWIVRSANTPCKIISSPSLNRHFDSGEGRKRELIDSCCFPNTPIYLFTHASLTLQPLPVFLS